MSVNGLCLCQFTEVKARKCDVCCKWYSEVSAKLTVKVPPKELLRKWFLYKGRVQKVGAW